MNGIQKVSGSIPLISTTHLIHHICPMWFFLFIPLTAVNDSLDFMRHFVPLKSVPYFAAASSPCFISIFTKTMSPPIQCRKTSCAGADGLRTGAGQHNNLLHRRIPSYSHFKNNISLKIHLFLSSVNSITLKIISHIIHHMNI